MVQAMPVISRRSLNKNLQRFLYTPEALLVLITLTKKKGG
jgi:hypothetical protein